MDIGQAEPPKGFLRTSKNRLALYLLSFFISFPYFTMFTKVVDTSLYALFISSVCFLIFIRVKVSRIIFLLLFLFFFSGLVGLIDTNFNFFFLRTAFGYFSVFVIAFSIYVLLKKSCADLTRFFFCITIIWFLVGLVQSFIYDNFLNFLVVRTNTTIDRGITSLAPEPTYYATIAFFLFLINYINYYKLKINFVILIFTVFVLAQSSTIAMVVFVSGVIYLISNFKFLSIKNHIVLLFIAFSTFSSYFFIKAFLENSRIYFLISRIIEGPKLFLTIDGSVNARFWHLFAPYISSYENSFIPQGYSGFTNSLTETLDRYPEYSHPYTYSYIGEKIQSGTGQLVYNLGLIGLIYFCILFYLTYQVLGVRKALFVSSTVFLIMSTAVPISIPFFGFLFGYMAYKMNYISPRLRGFL
jgi:hypothetical protein